MKDILVKYNRLIVVYLLIVFFWSVYRGLFTNPEYIDEFFAKPVIWLSVLFFVVPGIVHKLKNKLTWGTSKHLFFGIGLGILLAILQVIGRNVDSYAAISFITNNPNQLFLIFSIAIATALVEEIVFRVYIQESLARNIGIIWAMLLNSLLFVGIHIPRVITQLSDQGLAQNMIYLYILFLSSIIYGWVYYRFGKLSGVVATHALWNTIGGILLSM